MYWSARPEQRAWGQRSVHCWFPVLGLHYWLVTCSIPSPFRHQVFAPLPMSSMSRNPHLRFTIWRNSPGALHRSKTRPLDAAKDGDRKIGRQREMNGWIDGESEGRWRQREERREGEVLMNGLMAHWPTNVTAALPVAPSGLLKHTYRDLCVNDYKTQVGINSNTPMAFLHMHTGPLLLLLLLVKVRKRRIIQLALAGNMWFHNFGLISETHQIYF